MKSRPKRSKQDTVSQEELVKLQRKWENLRETYQSIKEAEAKQREKAGAFAEEVSRLENLNTGLAKETETAWTEVAEIKKLIEELREAQESPKGSASEHVRLEEERAALTARLSEVQEASAARLAELEGELATVKTASAAAETSMGQEVSGLREEVEKLSEDRQKLSKTGRFAEDKISELHERARRFEEEKAASAMGESAAKHEVEELEGRMEELTVGQAVANEDASLTQKKFNMLQGRWKKLNATCKELRKEIAAHDEEVAARETAEGAGERVNVLEKERETIELDLSAAQLAVEQRETQIASLAEEKQRLVEKLEARGEESATAIQEITGKHEKLRDRWNTLEGSYRSLKDSEEQEHEAAETMQGRVLELESQVGEAALDRVRLSREANSLRRAREVLMGRVSELEESCTTAEEKAAGMEGSAAGFAAEKAALVESSAALKDTIEGLEAQVAGLVEELDTTKNAHLDHEEKVSELRTQAVELAGEKGALLEVEAAMKAEILRLEARVVDLVDHNSGKDAEFDETKGVLALAEEKYRSLDKRWGNLRATYRAIKESEAEQRNRAIFFEERATGLEAARAELEEAEAKASQVAEELAAKVAKLNSSDSGLKEKVKHLEMQAKEAEVRHAATAGAEESSREQVGEMELELQQLRQENANLRGGRLRELEEQVEQLSEANSEFVATWEAQRRGAEAVGFDLDTLLGGLTRVPELQRDVVELEEANAAINQANELSNQKVSALEVDLEDYEEKISVAEGSEHERAGEVEQLNALVEQLKAANAELAATGDHSSERIVALESELEESETEDSVRVQKEEIELLQAQIAELQGSDSSLTDFELPTIKAVEDESDDDAMGVPAGHDPEDYEVDEVDDRPSWES